jgi:hypothetical protein
MTLDGANARVARKSKELPDAFVSNLSPQGGSAWRRLREATGPFVLRRLKTESEVIDEELGANVAECDQLGTCAMPGW